MKNKFTIFFLICYTVTLFLFGFYVQRSQSAESTESPVQILEVTVTAYSPSPRITDQDPLITASNKKVTARNLHELRFIAMSRDLMKKYNVKYGDEVWLSFIVEDTMHKRIKNTMDLFMRNLSLARNFGRQKRRIIILKNVTP